MRSFCAPKEKPKGTKRFQECSHAGLRVSYSDERGLYGGDTKDTYIATRLFLLQCTKERGHTQARTKVFPTMGGRKKEGRPEGTMNVCRFQEAKMLPVG